MSTHPIHLAMQTRTAEIAQLLAQPMPDLLAIENLQAANIRDLRRLTAAHIVAAAPRNRRSPEQIQAVIDQFFHPLHLSRV